MAPCWGGGKFQKEDAAENKAEFDEIEDGPYVEGP